MPRRRPGQPRSGWAVKPEVHRNGVRVNADAGGTVVELLIGSGEMRDAKGRWLSESERVKLIRLLGGEPVQDWVNGD